MDPVSWKQPVPTGILHDPEVTALDRAVYCEILLRCRRSDKEVSYMHGNKRIIVPLKRGQMIFPVARYAHEMEISERRVKKSIEFIQKALIELQIERRAYGLVITVLEYDSISKLQSETTHERRANAERTQSERRSSQKSVEKVKNVKNVKSEDAKKEFSLHPTQEVSEGKLDTGTTLELLEAMDVQAPAFVALAEHIVKTTKASRESAAQVLKGFASYWLEKDQRGTALWQKQKTFEVKRRLDTWIRNAVKFGELDPEEPPQRSRFDNIYS